MSELSRILDSVRRGNSAAWKRLVARDGPRLYRIARAVTQDGALAEDAVQEVFLRLAARRFPPLRGGAAETYLARSVTRAAIDTLRSGRTRKRREEEHAMSRESTDRPADALLAAELSEQVREALAVVPAETRAALWLNVVEEVGIREVARCVGLARSTVADRIRAGKDRIRQFLQQRGYVLPLAVSWPALLTDSQAAEMPPGLTHTLDAMGAKLVPASGALVSGVAFRAPVVALLSGKKTATLVSAGLLLVLTLCAALYVADSSKPEPPTREIVAAPAERDERPPLEPSPDPAPESSLRNVEEDGPTEELIVVDGIIYDRETYAPIDGATIAPENSVQRPPVKGARWTATSGADGHYRLLLPVSVEEYFVVSTSDYLPGRTFIRGTDDRWAHGSSCYNVSLLPELTIHGRVVDADDQPIGGAELFICGTSVGFSTTYLAGSADRKVRSNEDGSFVLPMVKYGQPRVVVYKKGYGGAVAVGTPPSASDFTLRVPPGATVSGVVVGVDGRPVPGQRVLWMPKEPGNTSWEGDAVTDDAGTFTIDGLPAPAEHFVFPGALTNGRFDSGAAKSATKNEEVAFVKTLIVAPGEELADVVLDLGALEEWQREGERKSVRRGARVAGPRRGRTTRPLRMHGTVLDPAGQPAHRAHLTVQLRAATDRGYADSYVGETLTDEQGRFDYEFDWLPTSARYKAFVTVSHPAWATMRESLGPFEVPDGSPQGVESAVAVGPYSFTLRPGCSLIGRVSDPSGNPLAGVQVIQLRERPGTVARKEWEMRFFGRADREMRFFGRTDETGGFIVRRKDPGEEIHLLFFHPSYVPLEIRRPAPGHSAGDAHDLGGLQVLRGGTIDGFVLGTDGGPVPYARVTVNGRELQAPALADGSGRFVLECVAPGSRELRVIVDTGHPWKNGLPLEGDAVLDVSDGMRYSVQVRLKQRSETSATGP